jgi:hypothetical protein
MNDKFSHISLYQIDPLNGNHEQIPVHNQPHNINLNNVLHTSSQLHDYYEQNNVSQKSDYNNFYQHQEEMYK